jgi:hypothetical protein
VSVTIGTEFFGFFSLLRCFFVSKTSSRSSAGGLVPRVRVDLHPGSHFPHAVSRVAARVRVDAHARCPRRLTHTLTNAVPSPAVPGSALVLRAQPRGG